MAVTDAGQTKPMRLAGRLDSVQVLRAIAALAVVWVHAPVSLFGGVWGVDLFFVISGFIICYVTERNMNDFLLKRAIRIVPLYWAGTFAVYSIALIAPNLLKSTSSDVIQLIKSLLFIPFIKGDGIYRPVLFLGWTLNMEMYFYLVFALSAAFSHRFRGLLCSAAIVVVVIIGHLLPIENDLLTFYSKGVVLNFVYGMGCYSLMNWLMSSGCAPPDSPRTRLPWVSMGLLCLGGMVALAPEFSAMGEVRDDYRAIIFGLPSAVCFFSFVWGLNGVRLPSLAVMLGDASYSLYLFHPYVIKIIEKVVPGSGGNNAFGYLMSFVIVAVCCVVSIFIYEFFEKPVTEWLRRRLVKETAKPQKLPDGAAVPHDAAAEVRQTEAV